MRIVVKVGTSLVTEESGKPNRDFLASLVEEVASLHQNGHEIVLVTSGAVACGRTIVALEKEKKTIPYRQVLAAVGQGILMAHYQELFRAHNITVAQALLTNYDFVNRENFLNTQQVFDLLLRQGVIPVVNENDVTTMAELRFGDNDMLSAKTASLVSADLLCILTDVDGLYEENPTKNPHAKLISIVEKIDDSIFARAGGAATRASRGGMFTKVEAAVYATSAGIPVCIVNGKKNGVLKDAVNYVLRLSSENFRLHASPSTGSGASVKPSAPMLPFTFGSFFPTKNIGDIQKKWMRPQIRKNAVIFVDEGAARALRTSGKSLLPSGVVKIEGAFERGDVVMVRGDATQLGYGQVNYSAVELEKIKRHKSSQIEGLLGYAYEEEVIHRDRMVVSG